MKMIATKARRHQGFTFNKTFCVTLCLSVFVANFMVGENYLPDQRLDQFHIACTG
jgi:hypothetical protein